MKKVLFICSMILSGGISFAQNPLLVPAVLNGPVYNLNVQNGTTQFWPNINTPTYGINGPILGPTLYMSKGDTVTLNVTNNLTGSGNSTTMHWHGLHVPAMDDGGPHQLILQNTTWSPQFVIMNNAGLYWYHPHGEGRTDPQVSRGLAGVIIIQDSIESTLALPRTYGVDDFPLVIQTKAFDVFNQIAIATAFDTVPMVNATVDAYVNVPAQVVRLRLLNGSSDRTFMIGFSNNMNFSVIGGDGGLLDSSVTMNRLILGNGERAEILVDLAALQNDSVYLMSYGSELPHGYMGADSVGDAVNQITDYYLNYLNGADFNLLNLVVGAPTSNPITAIPQVLISNNPIPEANATVYRDFELDTLTEMMMQPNPAAGPFAINRQFFEMDSINEIVYLNTTEVWTLHNKTMVAHPFHIHDVQFYILDIAGNPPPPHLRGQKDVVLVPPGDSVRFITRFENFADDSVPYMYHCHLLHHEDDGMMGSFLVIDTTTSVGETAEVSFGYKVYPVPADESFRIEPDAGGNKYSVSLINMLGQPIYSVEGVNGNHVVDVSNYSPGVYCLQIRSGNNVVSKTVVIRH
ncbi:MAG: multicopper oxidase domain-containing protein [Bacteroidia bacterium]|nr:multicopper oxidase domain-containing protein [Bacteroidia bacterium]